MIGRLLDQRYQVVELLAKGGFGHTYIAQDTRRPGNPTCVVKHLKPATNDQNFLPTARRLFKREAETLEKLGNHDHIPRLLAYFEENEEFYLVQEFIAGHPLSWEMRPGAKWSEDQVIYLLQEVLSILEFVHNNEVIHRDLKPDNLIRRNSDNKFVLVDFGAVKQVKMYSLMTPEQLKNETIPIGTPGYMPSEQAQGRPRPNSDIYALGIIGIQALTGLKPNQLGEDATSGEIIWQHHAQVSDELAAILSKMMRQYYKYRYQSAAEALKALSSITNPNTSVAVASVVNQMLRHYLRDGYVSATKMVHALQELAKPCYTPPDQTTPPNTTLPLETFTLKGVSSTQTTGKTARGSQIGLPNTYQSSQGSIYQSRRKLPLLLGIGSAIAVVLFGMISINRPPQPSSQTAKNEIQDTTQKTTDKNTATEEKNNCLVVVRSSNLHSDSGRRRTTGVIKAGTQVTVSGREKGGWVEISAPESGWIWKSRTKNTCPVK
jgi:serine/threonine protein kinase